MTVCYWCGAKDTLADVGKELDDGKYKMVQCSKCKNAYYVVNKEKMNKPKPMTNEEWFCSLPTEEKAKWLQEHMDCSNCDCNVVKTTTYCEVVARWQNEKNITAAGLDCKR